MQKTNNNKTRERERKGKTLHFRALHMYFNLNSTFWAGNFKKKRKRTSQNFAVTSTLI